MYYKLEITSVEDAVACPNCSRPVRVIRQPARFYGECDCGAKMEFTQRKAVRIQMRPLTFDTTPTVPAPTPSSPKDASAPISEAKPFASSKDTAKPADTNKRGSWWKFWSSETEKKANVTAEGASNPIEAAKAESVEPNSTPDPVQVKLQADALAKEAIRVANANGGKFNDAALNLFKQAVEIYPRHQLSLKDLGIEMQKRNEFALAAEYLLQAIEFAVEPLGDSSVTEFKINLLDRVGTCYSNLGRHQEAAEMWERVLREGTWSANAAGQIRRDIAAARAQSKGLPPPKKTYGKSGQGEAAINKVLNAHESKTFAEAILRGAGDQELTTMVLAWNFAATDARNLIADARAVAKSQTKKLFGLSQAMGVAAQPESARPNETAPPTPVKQTDSPEPLAISLTQEVFAPTQIPWDEVRMIYLSHMTLMAARYHLAARHGADWQSKFTAELDRDHRLVRFRMTVHRKDISAEITTQIEEDWKSTISQELLFEAPGAWTARRHHHNEALRAFFRDARYLDGQLAECADCHMLLPAKGGLHSATGFSALMQSDRNRFDAFLVLVRAMLGSDAVPACQSEDDLSWALTVSGSIMLSPRPMDQKLVCKRCLGKPMPASPPRPTVSPDAKPLQTKSATAPAGAPPSAAVQPKPAPTPATAPTPLAEIWHVAIQNKKLGPYSLSALRELAAGGQLNPDDMVLQQGGGKWSAAAEVAGLFAPKSTPENLSAKEINAVVRAFFRQPAFAFHGATPLGSACAVCGLESPVLRIGHLAALMERLSSTSGKVLQNALGTRLPTATAKARGYFLGQDVASRFTSHECTVCRVNACAGCWGKGEGCPSCLAKRNAVAPPTAAAGKTS